jgi:hypothetical protein
MLSLIYFVFYKTNLFFLLKVDFDKSLIRNYQSKSNFRLRIQYHFPIKIRTVYYN